VLPQQSRRFDNLFVSRYVREIGDDDARLDALACLSVDERMMGGDFQTSCAPHLVRLAHPFDPHCVHLVWVESPPDILERKNYDKLLKNPKAVNDCRANVLRTWSASMDSVATREDSIEDSPCVGCHHLRVYKCGRFHLELSAYEFHTHLALPLQDPKFIPRMGYDGYQEGHAYQTYPVGKETLFQMRAHSSHNGQDRREALERAFVRYCEHFGLPVPEHEYEDIEPSVSDDEYGEPELVTDDEARENGSAQQAPRTDQPPQRDSEMHSA
jgi:hypothetical protein